MKKRFYEKRQEEMKTYYSKKLLHSYKRTYCNWYGWDYDKTDYDTIINHLEYLIENSLKGSDGYLRLSGELSKVKWCKKYAQEEIEKIKGETNEILENK